MPSTHPTPHILPSPRISHLESLTSNLSPLTTNLSPLTLPPTRCPHHLPNMAGKSTLVELITGDNVLGYTVDVHLFGRKKGSGESVWDIKAHLGLLSTVRSHLRRSVPAASTFPTPESGL
jgi:hypothetical protein